MNLSANLQFRQTKILKSGHFYNVVLEHENYRINEPDQFLENVRISFFAFMDAENNLCHYNRLDARQFAKTNLYELLQIPSITKIYRLKFVFLLTGGWNSVALNWCLVGGW